MVEHHPYFYAMYWTPDSPDRRRVIRFNFEYERERFLKPSHESSEKHMKRALSVSEVEKYYPNSLAAPTVTVGWREYLSMAYQNEGKDELWVSYTNGVTFDPIISVYEPCVYSRTCSK